MTPRKCWNGTVALRQVAVRGPDGIGAPGRKPVHGMKHRQGVLRIMKKLHLCSLSLCLLGFFYKRVAWRQEKNMKLAATWNRYHLDQVEQAMKIQFPNDEIRNHDDRIGKARNNILVRCRP